MGSLVRAPNRVGRKRSILGRASGTQVALNGWSRTVHNHLVDAELYSSEAEFFSSGIAWCVLFNALSSGGDVLDVARDIKKRVQEWERAVQHIFRHFSSALHACS